MYAANAWHILATFGHPSIWTELNGNGIHSLTNILTLDPNLHTHFDNLDLWLEETVRIFPLSGFVFIVTNQSIMVFTS